MDRSRLYRRFRTLLIANRGEIACRVIRTARAMGLRSQLPDAVLLVLVAFAVVASLTAIGALLAVVRPLAPSDLVATADAAAATIDPPAAAEAAGPHRRQGAIARLGLAVGGHGVLQVEDHHVGRKAARLLHRARVGGGQVEGAAAGSGHGRAFGLGGGGDLAS